MSEIKSVDKAKEILKKLFRAEYADLDFGIYRIMNFKRNEIEQFIDNDLIKVAAEEFKEFAKQNIYELESELEQRKKEINEFVPGTIDDDWNIKINHDLPKVQDFIKVLEEYSTANVSEEQVQDVFNHIYEFFSRYYEEGDFIPKTRFGGREKYYVPYNGEEVLPYWATKDMYYVKTGESFYKYSFKAGKTRVHFKIVNAQIDQGNVKGKIKYFILHIDNSVIYSEHNNELTILFNYRALTEDEKEKYSKRKTQDDLINIALNRINNILGTHQISGILHSSSDGKKTLLKTHLEAYVQRNTKDYFIHKDLKKFLSKELEVYIKNEVLNLDVFENNSEHQTNLMIAKYRAIKNISAKIIDFIAQIENFQKKLFEKKKFVLKNEYCITLDLIPEEFYDEIRNNENQINVWKNLYKLDELIKGTFFNTNEKNIFDLALLEKYKYMMLDTQYFNNNFKIRLINAIQDIETKLDGILLHGDNYQVINLLKNRYEGKIKCVYIDPPYNTGNDGFIYKDRYHHSSWMTMINDRVLNIYDLLNEEGVLFVSIDDNEIINLNLMLQNIFGEENWAALFITRTNPRGRTLDRFVAKTNDYITTYVKNKYNNGEYRWVT